MAERTGGKQRRSLARQYALQALYQWQMTAQDVRLIQDQFMEDEELAKADVELFVDLLHNIPANINRLDEAISKFITRPIAQIDPVERAVLRMGTYELIYYTHIPYKVIINEAVELAKMFGAEQGHRYVNGVLDRVAKSLRSSEISPVASRVL